MAKNPAKGSIRPTQVRIGGFLFTIVWYDGALQTTTDKFGYFDATKQEIGLTTELSELRQAEVLLYEVMEGIAWLGGRHPEKDKPHDVLSYLDVGLISIFVQNPHVLAWIQSVCAAQKPTGLA